MICSWRNIKSGVLQSLRDALAKDRVKTTVNGFTQLGLVEMTRKRTRESLEHVLCEECPNCHGRGHVKSVETICYEIAREIIRVHHLYSSEQFLVYASRAVAEHLINEETHALLAEVEVFIGKKVQIKMEPYYTQEQFDVVVMLIMFKFVERRITHYAVNCPILGEVKPLPNSICSAVVNGVISTI